jgi:hypothetical protein
MHYVRSLNFVALVLLPSGKIALPPCFITNHRELNSQSQGIKHIILECLKRFNVVYIGQLVWETQRQINLNVQTARGLY